MPFGPYKDMDDCIKKNQDKDNPAGYCATIHKKITGKWPSEKQSYHERINGLFSELTREQKAKALVDSGEAKDMKDAYAQLEDMGESFKEAKKPEDFAKEIEQFLQQLGREFSNKERDYPVKDISAFKVRIEDGKIRVYTDSTIYDMIYDPNGSDYPRLFQPYKDKFDKWLKSKGYRAEPYGQGIISVFEEGVGEAKEIKEITICQVEGDRRDPRLDKKYTFHSVKEVEAHLSQSKMPEIGYDKHDVWITYSDGTKERRRYDHGKNELPFGKQLGLESVRLKEILAKDFTFDRWVDIWRSSKNEKKLKDEIAIERHGKKYNELNALETKDVDGLAKYVMEYEESVGKKNSIKEQSPIEKRAYDFVKAALDRGDDELDILDRIQGKFGLDISRANTVLVAAKQKSWEEKCEGIMDAYGDEYEFGIGDIVIHRPSGQKGRVMDAKHSGSRTLIKLKMDDGRISDWNDADLFDAVEKIKLIKNFSEQDVDPEQLRMGIEVEMEHTDDPKIAKKIALDHLAEIPDYYTRLKDMEAKSKMKESDLDLSTVDGFIQYAVSLGMPDAEIISITAKRFPEVSRSIIRDYLRDYKAGKIAKIESYRRKIEKLHKEMVRIPIEALKEMLAIGKITPDESNVDMLAENIEIGKNYFIPPEFSNTKFGKWGKVIGIQKEFVELDMGYAGRTLLPKTHEVFKGVRKSVKLKEGGIGLLSGDARDVLEGIVIANKDKLDIEILALVKKDRMLVEEIRNMGISDNDLLEYIRNVKRIYRLHKEMVFREANELLMAQNAARDAVMQLEKEFKSKLSGMPVAKYVTTKVVPTTNNGYRCIIEYNWSQHDKDVKKAGMKEDDKFYAIMDKYDQAFSDAGFYIQPETSFEDRLARGDAHLEYNYGRNYSQIPIRSRDEIKPAVKVAQAEISEWIQGLKL